MPIKYLSKGTLQKVAVIQALLTKSDVILLDEPLSGQDTDSQKYFIDCVKKLNREGTAIVMSCHEKWLMNMLSKTVYEIENRTLVKKQNLLTGPFNYVVMVFENGKQQKSSTMERLIKLNELALKIEIQQERVVVYAKRENCRRILLTMLQEGYELRRMNDENLE